MLMVTGGSGQGIQPSSWKWLDYTPLAAKSALHLGLTKYTLHNALAGYRLCNHPFLSRDCVIQRDLCSHSDTTALNEALANLESRGEELCGFGSALPDEHTMQSFNNLHCKKPQLALTTVSGTAQHPLMMAWSCSLASSGL